MRTKLNICFILPLLILCLNTPVFASGPDDENTYGDTVEVLKYENKIKRVEVYYTTGDYANQWYTVKEDANGMAMDIASANAGQMAGDFFSSQPLPLGHISLLRITIIGSFTVKAIINQDGTTYYSKSDGTVSTDPNDYAECILPFEDENGNQIPEMTDDPPESLDLEVTADKTVTMKVIFNLLSANSGGTTGAIGLREQSGTWQVAARRPNVTKEITSD